MKRSNINAIDIVGSTADCLQLSRMFARFLLLNCIKEMFEHLPLIYIQDMKTKRKTW